MGGGLPYAVLISVSFIWLGMVLAISFLEAPLKFRAPGITIPLGVGLGRLVFRALNVVELVWAVILTIAMTAIVDGAGPTVGILLAGLWVVLLLQVVALRPLMDRRVKAGQMSDSMPKSSLHIFYIVLECVKVVLLIAFATTAFSEVSV